jgi:nucleoside-diphosphate-sugar epimerase
LHIVITGGAGLVGHNLVHTLSGDPRYRISVIDKHERNLASLERLFPDTRTSLADLAEPGHWQAIIADADVVVILHAQISSPDPAAFVRNNIVATSHVLSAARGAQPFIVHVSSTVVKSVAKDHYSQSKTDQERLVRESGLEWCVLRPSLMFGWFDPKHIGWLGRFMERTPAFPIPGSGRYSRQPLYVRDFCRVIASCINDRPQGEVFDIVGTERIDYIDIIRSVKRAKRLRTPIVHVPVPLFRLLLVAYGAITTRPPFTADQLRSLVAGDEFEGSDLRSVFGITPTPFDEAINETFNDPLYSAIAPARP